MSIYEQEYQIFISYRREGGESLAAFLYERLVRMGYQVFYDFECLRSGKFDTQLLTVIEKCSDFLLICSPGGLDRCMKEDDWVRQEIRHAILHKKNIIPVMMRNFAFEEVTLPEEIDMIRNQNGISANMEFFDASLEKLKNVFLTCRPELNDDKDRRHINDLIRKVIEQKEGSLEEKNELAMIYENGTYHISQNLREAFRLYQEAAEAGYYVAEYNLADIYERCADDLTLIPEYGIGTEGEKDADRLKEKMRSTAYRCYEQLSKGSWPPALYKMGNIMEAEGNYKEAIRYYREAADRNYSYAQNALAWLYNNGNLGIACDREEAEALYKQAADSGLPAAIYNYAVFIEENYPKQIDEAIKLLRKVAFGDNALPMATYALGRIYEEKGEFRNAVICYEQAYENGVEDAGASLERCKNTVWEKLS